MNAQLVQLATDWRGDLPEGGSMYELKHDGWRCTYFRGLDGQPRLWTRQGIPIEGCEHIFHRLQLMERVAGEAMFFDGELVVEESLEATKAWCERGWRLGGEAGVFHAFDAMPYRDWAQDGSDAPLVARKARLVELARTVEEDPALSWEWRPGSRGRDEIGPTPVQVVADGWAFDAADVLNEARRVWADGGEGLMIKDAEAPYRRLRNTAWQKVKRENIHLWG